MIINTQYQYILYALIRLKNAPNSRDDTSASAFDIIDTNGFTRTFSIPTNNQLKSDIERLNNNINSLYSIDAAGSLIQTSNQNKFKKINLETE